MHPGDTPAADPLAPFHPAVAAWFRGALGVPTPAQAATWPLLAVGRHVLLCAPTGSGKTLAAFLTTIDRLVRAPVAPPAPRARPRRGAQGPTGGPDPAAQPPAARAGVRTLYLSPLKALDNDIHRNLQAPLAGIAAAAALRGESVRLPTVAVRTGDTPAAARRRQLRLPPDILITTPESLFLLLTAPRALPAPATIQTVIVDEIHALAGGKRGTHLALSLERLERLCAGAPGGCVPQRVGLSATQRPLAAIAAFLGGRHPVEVVDCGAPRPLALRVSVPVADFRDLPGDSVWDAIAPLVLRDVRAHRTTVCFVPDRARAESLTRRLNALAGEDLCRSHHGSVSREAREAIEADLRAGRLRALCATGTLELGIDVGAIDHVVLVGSPGSVARGLQRVRARALLARRGAGPAGGGGGCAAAGLGRGGGPPGRRAVVGGVRGGVPVGCRGRRGPARLPPPPGRHRLPAGPRPPGPGVATPTPWATSASACTPRWGGPSPCPGLWPCAPCCGASAACTPTSRPRTTGFCCAWRPARVCQAAGRSGARPTAPEMGRAVWPPPPACCCTGTPGPWRPRSATSCRGRPSSRPASGECAARALLLERGDGRRRLPLWLQRLRAADLQAAARRHPDFPLLREARRECLQDHFDLPAWRRVLEAVAARRIGVAVRERPAPSALAEALEFRFKAEGIYGATAPRAEAGAADLAAPGEEPSGDFVARAEAALRRRLQRPATSADELHDRFLRAGVLLPEDLGDPAEAGALAQLAALDPACVWPQAPRRPGVFLVVQAGRPALRCSGFARVCQPLRPLGGQDLA